MKNVFIGILILAAMTVTSNAAVIGGVTVTDSTAETGWGAAANIVNNNGFIPSTGWHFNQRGYDQNGNSAFDAGTDYGYHWFTKTLTPLPSLEFDLGPTVSVLESIKVWNLNWSGFTASGVAAMDIIVTDRNAVEYNLGEFILNQAPGTFGSDFGQVLDITDIASARYVRFVVKGMFFGFDRCGLSEVRFMGEYFGAGMDQTVEITGTTIVVNLDGSAGASPVTWTVDSSPAGSTVIFGNPDAQDTTATLNKPGVYVLRLTDDATPSLTDTVQITVNKIAIVGVDQFVSLSSGSVTTNLDGTCTTAVTWSVDSGPAAVVFTPNADALDPTATFTAAGTYVLRMTDDLFGVYDTMKVTVFKEPLAPGLVGYWSLDGDALDGSAYSNNGIVYGAPQYVDGKVGQAVKFDGLNDGIEIPNEWFFEGASPEMTVSFWAKIPYGAHPEGVVVAKKDFTLDTNAGTFPPQNKGIGWGIDSANTWRSGFIILLGYGINGGRYSVGYGDADFNYDTYSDGKWRHYAVSITASGGATYYIDGVNMGGTGGFTVANMTNDTPLCFGMSASFPGARNWAGYLDEVRFYNYALTQQQVLDLITADGGTCASAAAGDINGDCEVNINDFADLAGDWLLNCVYPNCL